MGIYLHKQQHQRHAAGGGLQGVSTTALLVLLFRGVCVGGGGVPWEPKNEKMQYFLQKILAQTALQESAGHVRKVDFDFFIRPSISTLLKFPRWRSTLVLVIVDVFQYDLCNAVGRFQYLAQRNLSNF